MNNVIIPKGVVFLMGVNLVLAIVIAMNAKKESKRFVLTPIYQVVPKGSVWTAEELSAMNAEMPNALEARDMHKAYASLGSTLTVDDVIKGVDALSTSSYPLTTAQQQVIKTQIGLLRNDHKEMVQAQEELIRLENRLVKQTKAWGVMP